MMDCSHLLCDYCVATCCLPVQPCHYQSSLCFLCQQPNHTTFVLNPPTAGLRKLELGCPSPRLYNTAERLFCSLFYIELSHKPNFYASPDNCVVKILCRTHPSPALTRTLAWLHVNRIHIKYRGHQSSMLEAVLCTAEVLQKCWEGQPFCRTVVIAAHSLDTIIQMQLGPIEGRFHHVSNSPYKLGHLLQHQEQGWLFNSQGHRQNWERSCNSALQLELDRLIEVIRLTL